jgi:hypothetical protein
MGCVGSRGKRAVSPADQEGLATPRKYDFRGCKSRHSCALVILRSNPSPGSFDWALEHVDLSTGKPRFEFHDGCHVYCPKHGSSCHLCEHDLADCEEMKFPYVVLRTGERLVQGDLGEPDQEVAKRLDFSDPAPGVRHTRNSLPPPIPGKVRETRHSLPARLLARETDAISALRPVSSISTPMLAQETDSTPPPVPTNGKELGAVAERAAVSRTVPIELPYVPGATYTVSFDHNGNLQVSVC